MLTWAVWGLGGKMFTKLRFQSRSKKFWSCWLINQYAIIARSRLISTNIWIHDHFSTFSEYCERSTWQFGTNVINQKFWCVSYLFTSWSLQSRRHGGFWGLSPTNKAPSLPPNWTMKHYESVKFLWNFRMSSPWTNVKPPILKTFWRRFWIFAMLIMQYILQFRQRNTNMCNINLK